MPVEKRAHTEITGKQDDASLLTLFHSFPDIVFIISPKGIILDANQAFASHLNKTPEEFIGLNVFDFLPPEVGAIRMKMVQEAMLTAKPLTFDDESDGRWLRSTIYPYTSSEGNVDRLLIFAQDITDIEQLLKKEQLFNRQIINAIPGTFCILDAKGNFVSWNDQMRDKILGISEKEMAEAFVINAIHPDEQSRFVETMQEIMSNDTEVIGEFRIVPRGSTAIRWHLITGKKIMIDGLPFFIGNGLDITERKLAEAELHRLNRVLIVSDHCNEALIQAQDERELLQKICSIIVESGGYRMAWVGYAVDDEAKSLHPAVCAGSTGDYFETTTISWADDQYGQGPAGTAIRTGQTVAVNHILTDKQFNLWRPQAKKNGYAAILGLPLSIDNRVVGALTIYSEVADAFNAAETMQLTSLANNLAFGIKMLRKDDALRKSEQINALRLRILQMADTHSVEELLVTTLDEAERLTGSVIGLLFFVAADQNSLLLQAVSTNTRLKMGKMDGKGVHDLLDKASIWADALREKKAIIHNDYPLLKHRKGMPEGHPEVRRELVVPVNRDGKIVAIMGVGNKQSDYDDNDIRYIELIANQVWDIVAKKIAEEEQKRLAAQLQQAMKMEMIGQLAAGIAHEINNPLNFITINAQIILEDFNDFGAVVDHYRRIIEKGEGIPALAKEMAELREEESMLDIDELLKDIPDALKKLQNGIERISTITHSMRSYSFQNVSEQLFPFDLNKAIREALVIAKHEYSALATVTLNLEELPQLLCDPSQIGQVILNLIINSSHAIKSQNRDSLGKITIKTWTSGENIVCSVTDDGPGIPEKVIHRIFEPFFTTKEPGKGTGLGLSISYDIIVNKHKGTLSAISLPEGGATFTFTLPIQIGVQA
jgi:PAS domain S-box-containing protein